VLREETKSLLICGTQPVKGSGDRARRGCYPTSLPEACQY